MSDDAPKLDPPAAPWHRIIVHPGEDRDEMIASLIASGEAKEGDNFIVITIVEPIGAGYPSYVLDQWGSA